MERRVFVAVLLSFLVVYAYQALFVPAPPPQPKTEQQQPANPPAQAAPRSEASPTAAPLPTSRALVSESSERDIVVETETVRAVFTNRGGRIKQWLLKKYQANAEGELVNLVPTSTPDLPLPFSLRVDEGGLTPTLNNSLYRVNQSGTQVTFDYEDESGLRVRKDFSLHPQKYLIDFSASVRQGDRTLNPYVQWGPGLGDIGATSGGGSFFTGNLVQPPQAIFGSGKDVTRIVANKVSERPVHEGTFGFAGVDDHYFLAAAVNPGAVRVEYRDLKLPALNAESGQHRELLAHSYRFPQPPSGKQFFFGPKSFDVLKSINPDLTYAIHFGTFRVIAVPFLTALQSIHTVIGNYGWAIIVLTILINLALAPLKHWSILSMRRVQEIQPLVKAIQDRYADVKVTDPARQKMNTEIMGLYREKGVNPAIGCVPMLLTFPVLLAFYSFLSVSIELRGAEFIWWIRDLSRPDPYYVTPLLMAASMFWQQRITPTTGDPAQQRIMMFMPIMFSIMFISAPSGLVIYWFMSNMLAIGQQYFTNWWIGPPRVPSPRPPAERRMKQAGFGKTLGAKK